MFTDRKDAGLQLAGSLLCLPMIQQADRSDLLVLSIPRGGVIIGMVLAQALHCEHSVVVAKKVGFPGGEELAVGAIAEDGFITLNHPMLAEYGLTMYDLEPQIARARSQVDRYVHLFRQGKPLDISGKTVILADDGIATGETMKAAIRWVKSKTGRLAARGIIMAVPVCSPTMAEELAPLVDDMVCLSTPRSFMGVGQFYLRFEPISDSQVLQALQNPITDTEREVG